MLLGEELKNRAGAEGIAPADRLEDLLKWPDEGIGPYTPKEYSVSHPQRLSRRVPAELLHQNSVQGERLSELDASVNACYLTPVIEHCTEVQAPANRGFLGGKLYAL